MIPLSYSVNEQLPNQNPFIQYSWIEFTKRDARLLKKLPWECQNNLTMIVIITKYKILLGFVHGLASFGSPYNGIVILYF